MKILVAEDDEVTRRLLEALVVRMGHQAVTACDGGQALAVLESDDPPDLALLDWVMPVLDGHEVCKALRTGGGGAAATYIILLTARSRKADIVAGLRAGANDYVVKPFDAEELTARIDMGIRMACLERRLRSRNREIETLESRLETIERLLPTCPECQAPRNDPAYWVEVAAYLAENRTHAPSCAACLAPAAVR